MIVFLLPFLGALLGSLAGSLLYHFRKEIRWTFYILWLKTVVRTKRRFFPKHRLKRVVNTETGVVTTTVPLSPGMVPAPRVWDIGDPMAPTKSTRRRLFGVLIGRSGALKDRPPPKKAEE